MWRPGQVEQCAFCGRTIEPGEERVGRGDSAAHVSCADAALGDDRLWEGVGGDAVGAGEPPPSGDEGAASAAGSSAGPAATSRGGCLAIAIGLLLLGMVGARRHP